MWVEKFGYMRLLFSRTCQSLACYSVQVFPWKAWRSYLNSLVFLEFGQSTFYISCYFSMQCGGFLGCFPAGWAVSCAALCSGCCLELFWGKSNHKSLPTARGQAWVAWGQGVFWDVCICSPSAHALHSGDTSSSSSPMASLLGCPRYRAESSWADLGDGVPQSLSIECSLWGSALRRDHTGVFSILYEGQVLICIGSKTDSAVELIKGPESLGLVEQKPWERQTQANAPWARSDQETHCETLW